MRDPEQHRRAALIMHANPRRKTVRCTWCGAEFTVKFLHPGRNHFCCCAHDQKHRRARRRGEVA